MIQFPRLVILILTLLLEGCDCNSGTPARPDTGTGACPSVCSVGTYCCNKTRTCEPETPTCTNLQTCPEGQEITYPARPYMDVNTCQPIPLQCSCKSGDLKPGIIGRFSALAVSNTMLMASAYESSFGDLLLLTARTTDLNAAPTLEIVDGVPAVAPTKPVSSWRGGVEDPGDDVGKYTDILLDASGNPMIVYYDATNRSLKFASRAENKWTTHVVDRPKGDKDAVGLYGAAMLIQGKPVVAYTALGVPVPATQAVNSELRWATAASAKPSAAGDWTISVIDATIMSCQNFCGSGMVCVPSSDGNSFCRQSGTGCQNCTTGEACVDGACTTILPDTKLVDVPKAGGLWPAVTQTASGPLVVYYNRITGRLLGAALTGTTWKKQILAGSDSDDVGAFPAVASDGGAVAHVTFQDAAKLTLNYLQVDGASLAAAHQEVIDNGTRTDGQHSVGADSAVILDTVGTVRVIYQDQTRSTLLAVKRNSPTEWLPNVASDADLGRLLKGGTKGYGFYSDLVLQSGEIYGSTFYYDAQSTSKGGLSFFKLP